MRLSCIVIATAALSSPAFAVGPEDDAPPTPTETTTVCEEGQVWDPEGETCVAPRDANLNDDDLFRAARELAYAGRFDGADGVLDAMADQSASAVQTYRGFIARKIGDWSRAKSFYDAALTADPDNLLARSYLGQGLLAQGDRSGAVAQLSEIRARGGRNTWAEAALAISLSGGDRQAY